MPIAQMRGSEAESGSVDGEAGSMAGPVEVAPGYLTIEIGVFQF
jgi:hypothetical protein